MQFNGYIYFHVSGQRQTGLEKKKLHEPWISDARDARAVCVFAVFKHLKASFS